MPPAKIVAWLAASFAATKAPTSVPTACPKKGNRKLAGVNNAMLSCSFSMEETSAPSGSGTIDGPMFTKVILATDPSTTPAITAKKFCNPVFIKCRSASRDGWKVRGNWTRSTPYAVRFFQSVS